MIARNENHLHLLLEAVLVRAMPVSTNSLAEASAVIIVVALAVTILFTRLRRR